MRILALIVLLLFAAAGIAVGALNADAVPYDLGFARLSLPKGAALLVALLVGWVLGGLTAWLGTRVGDRRQRRRQAKVARTADA
jgi:lipopolysaccharide assembly protein A